MVAHGGHFSHLGMLTENENIEKGREKDYGSGARRASTVAAVAAHTVTMATHAVMVAENEGIVRRMKKMKTLNLILKKSNKFGPTFN